jgi:hypothetical protein
VEPAPRLFRLLFLLLIGRVARAARRTGGQSEMGRARKCTHVIGKRM